VNIFHEVKQYIFETIIPEVLKSVMPNKIETEAVREVKQKAKELYNITL
jgi:hypothetical protein